MEPSSFVTAAAGGLNSSFQSASGPTVWYLVWVAIWLTAVLGLALFSFQTREV
jgi:hypothetical protein